jgi:hypothetical protein
VKQRLGRKGGEVVGEQKKAPHELKLLPSDFIESPKLKRNPHQFSSHSTALAPVLV